MNTREKLLAFAAWFLCMHWFLSSCPECKKETYKPVTGFKIMSLPDFDTSSKPLIIGAGRGSTGTKFIAKTVSEITGKCVTHWTSSHKCSQEQKSKWHTLFHKMNHLPRYGFNVFDFKSLEEFDAVFDVPIPNLFPYIFRTFPNAKVILTVRDANEWVAKRGRRWAFWRVPPPFLLENNRESIQHFLDHKQDNSMFNLSHSSWVSAEVLFAAYNGMVRSMVPSNQLLVLNVFEETDEDIKKKITDFLI